MDKLQAAGELPIAMMPLRGMLKQHLAELG